MLIVWGKKVVRKTCGHAGHFCFACREVSFFRVTRLVLKEHLYYITLGRGKDICAEFKCQTCGVALGFDSSACSRAIPGRPPAGDDARGIAEQTSPWGPARLRARLELEGRLRAGRLSPSERAELLSEPIREIDYLAQVVEKRGSHQSVTAVIGALGVIGLFVCLILGFDWFDARKPSLEFTLGFFGTLIVTLGLLGLTVYRGLNSGRLAVRGKVLDFVVRSLAPLRPQRAELESVLGDLRKLGFAVATHLTAADIVARLDAAAVSHTPKGR